MTFSYLLFCRGMMMSAMVLSLSVIVHAQEKAANPADDTTKYVPYRIMQGHRVAQSKFGELNIRPYTYLRYLNQKKIDETYTDGFGNKRSVAPRQDIQLQKVSIYFTGWAFDPKFTYFLYVWTSNAAMGQGAQVVIAGNIAYNFNKHFKVLGGITSLPGVKKY